MDLENILKGIAEELYAKENKIFRELLWLRHGCTGVALYGDDGEMQCNSCRIDFRRDNANFIEKRLIEITTKAYEESQKVVGTEENVDKKEKSSEDLV